MIAKWQEWLQAAGVILGHTGSICCILGRVFVPEHSTLSSGCFRLSQCREVSVPVQSMRQEASLQAMQRGIRHGP